MANALVALRRRPYLIISVHGEGNGLGAIDGVRLRQDREDRNFSRDALREAVSETTGIRLSISTLRRAEAGKATRQTIRAIARTLGFPELRYTRLSVDNDYWRTSLDLNGEWLAYYLEDDVGAPPYIATERLFLKHTGSNVRGTYEPLSSNHPSGYLGDAAFLMEGSVIDNMIMGQYHVSGRSHPRGSGVFQHILTRNGCWAEGACSFFGDDGTIMVSVNFWIKKDAAEFDLMRKQVEQILHQHKPHLKFPISIGNKPFMG